MSGCCFVRTREPVRVVRAGEYGPCLLSLRNLKAERSSTELENKLIRSHPVKRIPGSGFAF